MASVGLLLHLFTASGELLIGFGTQTRFVFLRKGATQYVEFVEGCGKPLLGSLGSLDSLSTALETTLELSDRPGARLRLALAPR
jgi:hypothetical protein